MMMHYDEMDDRALMDGIDEALREMQYCRFHDIKTYWWREAQNMERCLINRGYEWDAIIADWLLVGD